MNRFEIQSTPLGGLRLLARKPIGDERGWFERMFCADDLRAVLDGRSIVQINRTLTSKAGTIRGMHFQRPPHAEMKLVSCLRGCVFDVAVDLRKDSPTFLKWHGVELGGEQPSTLAIPEGFAHGFQTLTEDCELLYFHTASYCQAAEGGVNPLDDRLAINWPMPVAAMSDRDRSHPPLNERYEGIAL